MGQRMIAADLTPAGMALGLGGGTDESDDERRKRLLAQQQAKLLPNSSGYNIALSPAGMALNLGQNNF
jgi:hypothetical protein